MPIQAEETGVEGDQRGEFVYGPKVYEYQDQVKARIKNR